MIGRYRNKKAFSLIETILYIGIAGIVLVSLFTFGWNMIGVGAKNSVHHDVVANGRFVVEKLSFFIREATDIDAANSNFGVNLAGTSNKITLRADTPNDPIVFDVSGGALRVKLGAATAVPVTSSDVSVSSIVFTNYSSVDGKTKNIRFELQLDAVSGVGRQEYTGSVHLVGDSEIRSNSL